MNSPSCLTIGFVLPFTSCWISFSNTEDWMHLIHSFLASINLLAINPRFFGRVSFFFKFLVNRRTMAVMQSILVLELYGWGSINFSRLTDSQELEDRPANEYVIVGGCLISQTRACSLSLLVGCGSFCHFSTGSLRKPSPVHQIWFPLSS